MEGVNIDTRTGVPESIWHAFMPLKVAGTLRVPSAPSAYPLSLACLKTKSGRQAECACPHTWAQESGRHTECACYFEGGL